MEFPGVAAGISVPILCGVIFLVFRKRVLKHGKDKRGKRVEHSARPSRAGKDRTKGGCND